MKLARTGIIAVAMLAVATIAIAQNPELAGTGTRERVAAYRPVAGGLLAG